MLPCGTHIVTRPCRKRARLFTEKDLVRISKLVAKDGVSPLRILGFVAVGLGLGWLLCRAAGAIRSTLSILNVIREIAVVMASATVIRIIIEFIKGGKLIRVPGLGLLVAFIVALLLLIERAISAAETLVSNIQFINELSGYLETACQAVAEASDSTIDAVTDLFD